VQRRRLCSTTPRKNFEMSKSKRRRRSAYSLLLTVFRRKYVTIANHLSYPDLANFWQILEEQKARGQAPYSPVQLCTTWLMQCGMRRAVENRTRRRAAARKAGVRVGGVGAAAGRMPARVATDLALSCCNRRRAPTPYISHCRPQFPCKHGVDWCRRPTDNYSMTRPTGAMI